MKFLIVLSLMVSCIFGADERWWDVLPKKNGYYSKRTPPEKASAKEILLLQQKNFEHWTHFENEYIRFDFPKHPLIHLEVEKSKGSIKITNGTYAPHDSFRQRFTLKVGDITYARFYVHTSDKIEHTTCFCGALAYHAYKIDHGTLTCFSMLAGGKVKTAQVLGGGLVFVASEWTHLACPASIYERMADSMRLKTSDPKGDAHLRKKIISHFGDDAKLGLIQKGASSSDLISAFGNPQTQDEEIWTWQWIGQDYPMTLKAKVKDAQYLGLVTTGIQRDTRHPVRGSLPWCKKIIYQLANLNTNEDGLDDLEKDINEENQTNPLTGEVEPPEPSTPTITVADQRLVISKLTDILKKGPSGETNEWYAMIILANQAARNGLSHKSWAGLIIDRGIGIHPEIELLKTLKFKNLEKWLTDSLEKAVKITHRKKLLALLRKLAKDNNKSIWNANRKAAIESLEK